MNNSIEMRVTKRNGQLQEIAFDKNVYFYEKANLNCRNKIFTSTN